VQNVLNFDYFPSLLTFSNPIEGIKFVHEFYDQHHDKDKILDETSIEKHSIEHLDVYRIFWWWCFHNYSKSF
jgi:hypothetical protein